MPSVTTDRKRLTTQIRKYSPLRPVKSKRYVVSAALPQSFTRSPRMTSGNCTGLLGAAAADGCARFSVHVLSFRSQDRYRFYDRKRRVGVSTRAAASRGGGRLRS